MIAVTNASGIELSWAYASDPAVTSYRIYRCATERGKYSLLETVKKPGTRYKDTTAVVGEPTYYRVAPVDDLGRQGKTVLVTVARPGTWEWSQLGTRHILFVLLAFGTFLVVGHIRYTKLASADRLTHNPLKSPVLWALAIAALSCVAVLAPGIGTSVNGARRWIKLGPIQVQPSELAKWAAVLFLAWWLTRPSTEDAELLPRIPADADPRRGALPARGDPGLRHGRADRPSARSRCCWPAGSSSWHLAIVIAAGARGRRVVHHAQGIPPPRGSWPSATPRPPRRARGTT